MEKTEDEIRKELIEKFYQIANDFDEKDFVEFGTGEKGKEFLQNENSPLKAAKFLLNKKSGMVRNAFKNTPYGNVGLAYGDDDGGMYHIVLKHILELDDFDSVTETMNTIDDVLRNGTEKNKNQKKNNIVKVIEKDNNRVVLGLNKNGNLIVTSYDFSRKESLKQRKSSDITLIDRDAFMKDGTLVPSEDWLNYNIKNYNLSNSQIQFHIAENNTANSQNGSENSIQNIQGDLTMENTQNQEVQNNAAIENQEQNNTVSSVEYLLEKINKSGITVHLSKDEMKAILEAGKDVQKMAVKYGTSAELEQGNEKSFSGYGTYVVSVNEENAKQLGIKIASRKYGGTFYINNQPLSDFLQDKNFSPFWSKRLEEVKSHSVDELTDEVLRADVKGNPQLEREQQAMSTLLGLDLIKYKREQTYLYSVDIPDNDNTNYLMYNNPIGIDAANRINEQLEKMSVDWRVSRSDSGKSVYFDVLSKNIFDNNQKPASEFLNSIGFVGMQMDSSNYIIFNDRNMSITDRVQYMKDREGEVYGFAFEGDIYVDEDLVNSNVLAHEYTHIWDKYVQNENPELWQQGKDILKGTSLWQEIIEDKNYENLRNDDEILSEVHARITGQFAQQVLERIEKQDGELTKDRVIDWDKEVSQYIAEELLIKPELGNENYISDSVRAEYLQQFLSMPMKDLMNEVKINQSLSEINNNLESKLDSKIYENENLSITKNLERNGIEIKFQNRVSKKGIKKYLEEGFKWSKNRQLLYAENTEQIKTFVTEVIKDEEEKTFLNNNNLFNKNLQKFERNKLPENFIFSLGKPSETLIRCGFPEDENIELSSYQLKMKLKKHNFNPSDIRNLVIALENPVAVFSFHDNPQKYQNVIVDLEKNGKHFLVGVEFNQTERGISVSDVRGIFDKQTPSWMNWITQGKMIYGNKEKIQSVIAEQRTTLAEVNYLKLDSINSILEKYPNVNNIFTNEDSIYENAVEEEWKKYPTAYTELKLLPSERERIINSYNPALQGNYRTLCDHSTVKYGIQEFNEKEGTLSQLEVIGRLTTDKVDVLLVKNSDSENKYPHITLAVAEGVSPNESNKEIEENLDDVIPLSDLISVEFRNINTKNHKEFTETDIQKLKKSMENSNENQEALYFGDIGDGLVYVYTKEEYIEKFGEEPSENSRLDDDQVKNWQNKESEETVDKGIEQLQANDGMSEAAMEADIAAEENPRANYLDEQGNPHWFDEEEEEQEYDNQIPFEVINSSEMLYTGSDKVSGISFLLRTDDSLKNDIAPDLRDLKENEHLIVEYRKWNNGEENTNDFSVKIMQQNDNGTWSVPEDLHTRNNQNRADSLADNEQTELFKESARGFVSWYEEHNQNQQKTEPAVEINTTQESVLTPEKILPILESFSNVNIEKWNLPLEDKTDVYHLTDIAELKKNDKENSIAKLTEYFLSEEYKREEENYTRILAPILTSPFVYSTDDIKQEVPEQAEKAVQNGTEPVQEQKYEMPEQVEKGNIESIAGNPFTGNNEKLVQGFQDELISKGIVKPEEKLVLLTELEANARGSKIKENQPFVLLNVPVQNGEKTEFVSTKYYHISSFEKEQKLEAKIYSEKEVDKKAKNNVIYGKTKLPEVSLLTQTGLQLYKDMVVESYDKNSQMYFLKSQDGEKSLHITENTLNVLISDEYNKQAKTYTEDTKIKEKMIKQQYEDFFELRSNCANNFRHNLAVFCRKEANSPLDALQIASSLIKQMPKEEQHKTKQLLDLLKKEDQSVNEVLIETYHEAVKDSPLNEEYLKRGRYENIVARPMYDTVSREGEKLDKNFNLKIGDTVDVQFKVSKNILGKSAGKENLTFANCKIISSTKEGNMVTLMDGNKSFYDVPRDTFLKEYARTEKHNRSQENSTSHKHSMKIEISR